MARQTCKLNVLTVQKTKMPGMYSDGNGLYLSVARSGAKSWIFRFSLNGRAREMGLGPVTLVSLSEARNSAHVARKSLHEGVDPIEERRARQSLLATEASRAITFDECAKAYISSHRPGWRNSKHADQWENTLKTYVSPVIGHLPVRLVDTTLTLKVLEPIWFKKTETASRVRSRIELILAWATVRGYRPHENPATWRNHLDKILPKRSKVAKVKHFAALPFSEMGAFVERLKAMPGIAPRALEFLILTATRTSETLNMQWREINFDEKLWIIPSSRTKTGVEHRVPLSAAAIEILIDMQKIASSDFVFPGLKVGRPPSNMSLLALLRRMGLEITTHGFRSSFRDWSAERTNFPAEVCEQALAHTLRDKVESAYRRGDLLLKRRVLMDKWAEFCATKPANVSVVDLQSGTEWKARQSR